MPNFPTDIAYFHGTGNMAHNFGASKYQGKVEGTRNVLNEILNDGIKPFPDPLNPDYSATTSLTADPKYALLYALLYSEKGTAQTYGVNRFGEWARVLSKILIEAKPFSFKKYRVKGKRIVGNKEFKTWANSFNDTDYQKGILSGFRAMIWGESNIEGNFPVVLGIRKLSLETKEMSGWNEMRVHGGIPPENISAIFIPKDKIQIFSPTNIPVFPLEDFIQTYS